MEHYCTLFDRFFLPQGLALHASLRRHAAPFTLWILCMDGQTKAALESLALPEIRLLALEECETPELRAARGNRSHGEYCWTLASHLFSFVFSRSPEVRRLTYLDADVYFFGPPGDFFDELEGSGKPVLITEHAYDPAWGHYAATAGRFCVQFVTFTRTPEALALLEHWQRQTRDSCSAERGAAAFGDQKYLDDWPVRHPGLVHVLDHRYRTVAPWNADHAIGRGGAANVVFYHFHTFRILGKRWIQWGVGYTLREAAARRLYEAYESEVLAARRLLAERGHSPQVRPFRPGMGGWLRLMRSFAKRELHLHRHGAVAET
jgi:hypothetical protein